MAPDLRTEEASMTTVSSPVSGRAIALDDVPDPVFAGAMVGPGVAVDPPRARTVAVAPVDGVLVSVHPHAFVVVDNEGHGVLVHLGIDTVQLNGEGFALLAAKGDMVTRGQPVVRWDPAAVEESGKSPVCPVIALEATVDVLSRLATGSEVAAGDTLFDWK
jgi:PTS system N-acetylglucosamine-specific IIA component